MSSKALYQTNQILFRKNQMNKQQRKIRELRARFVTKLTKQTQLLRAFEYTRIPGGRHKGMSVYSGEKEWVNAYNKWYQLVGRNPKQSADQIRVMTVSQKNKFYSWLTHDYTLFNPWGNHFEEKFSMMVFVLSKPKTMENLRLNNKVLRRSYETMQDSVGKPGTWASRTFQEHCDNFREFLNYQLPAETEKQQGVKVSIDLDDQSTIEESICVDRVWSMYNPSFVSIYTHPTKLSRYYNK